MSFLKTIASGIAHEFNNILAVVYGFAEVLEVGYEDEQELKTVLHNIMNASDKGVGIVRKTLLFAEADKNTTDCTFIDLQQLIFQAINCTIPRWWSYFI